MTATDRSELIETVVRNHEQGFPGISVDTLMELVSHRLAVNYGLVVTRDEIERTLARSAKMTP